MAYSYSPEPSPSARGVAGRRTWFGGLKMLAGMVILMWVVAIADFVLPGTFATAGIRSWSFDGLIGIVFSPFLHADFAHLISNSVPLITLGVVIALSGPMRLLAVSAIVAGVSGIGVWFASAPGTLTIGASGLVFGYAAYLIVRGVFNKRILQLVIGAAVIFIWGTALLGGILPQGGGISWQGHLFGAVGGVLAGWLLADHKPASKVA